MIALMFSLFLSLAHAQTRGFPRPDPYFNLEWALSNDGTQTIRIAIDALHEIRQKGTPGIDIGWKEARSEIEAKAKNPVLVAVIDSGVDSTHPDLLHRISDQSCDILNNESNADTCTAGPPIDDEGHGTHVSGIIAAISGNGIGIAGAAPARVSILALRVLGTDVYQNYLYRGRLVSDYVADAVRYAIKHQAKVINLSLAWPKLIDNLNARSALKEALDAGIIVVAAAGNDQKDVPTYPCAYDGVICVGAVTNTGALAHFSNRGGQVDLLAPGEGIASLIPDSEDIDSATLRIRGYDLLSGTSQASPFISAMVAILKSIEPSLSPDAIRAKLFAGTLPKPEMGSSLYGLPRLNQVLQQKPSAIYYPHLKGKNILYLNEKTATIGSEVEIENLGSVSGPLKVKMLLGARSLGEASAKQLNPSERVSLSWKLPLSGLDQDSEIPLVIEVSDANGFRSFPYRISVAREANAVSSVKNLKIPQNGPYGNLNWIATANQKLFFNLKPILTYGIKTADPTYARILKNGTDGSTIQTFEPLSRDPVHNFFIPAITVVDQVFKMDLLGNGKPIWVVTGNFPLGKDRVFQFYFFNDQGVPVSERPHTWRISLAGDQEMIERDFTQNGSWIRGQDGQLYPSFLNVGSLPDADNFDWYDPRHYSKKETHLYFLSPKSPATSGNLELSLRALDTASVRGSMQNFKLVTMVSENQADLLQGHLRVLVMNDEALEAELKLWDISSTTHHHFERAPTWNALAGSGQTVRVYPDDESVLLNFYGVSSGGLTWVSPKGEFLGRSDFTYEVPRDPITAPKGIFDLKDQGKFIFLTSQFKLVGLHAGLTRTLSLNRDSSFADQTFTDLLTPVALGTMKHPEPGVLVDSTLIESNQMSVARWNPVSNEFAKPIRYSLLIPKNCVALPPVQLPGSDQRFNLPLLCTQGNDLEYQILQPGRL